MLLEKAFVPVPLWSPWRCSVRGSKICLCQRTCQWQRKKSKHNLVFQTRNSLRFLLPNLSYSPCPLQCSPLNISAETPEESSLRIQAPNQGNLPFCNYSTIFLNSGSGNQHSKSPNTRMWTEYRIWPLVQLNLWNSHMLFFILYLVELEEKNNIHLRKTLVTADLLATLFPLAFLEETKRKSSCTN